MQPEYDVVIVGGGPVGCGLAIELGQRGIRVCVIERDVVPQRIPKGQNLTQRTMEHMHFWGVEDGIRGAKTVPDGVGIGGLTAYGTLLGGYHYDWLVRAVVRPYYFTDNERLPQYETERVLRARLGEIDCIDVFYGWVGGEIAQNDVGANVTACCRKSGQSRTITGKYLVGCDGGFSGVRETSGITQTRRDHDRLMALLVFRSPELFNLLQVFTDKQFFNVLHPDLEGYWMFFGMVDWGQSFFFHAPVPDGTTAENFDFEAYLHRAVGADFAVEFEHVGLWKLRIAIADNYQAGRIFVAGDAAHSHPPYGGYGINTGFEDAANLGWKLAAVLEGWGGTELLASYDNERRPVFASTASDFIEAFIASDRAFLAAHNPDKDRGGFEAAWAARSKGGVTAGVSAFVPNYEGSNLVFGPPGAASSARGAHILKARPGHHLAPQTLSDGSNVFERLGHGFTLICLDTGERAVSAFKNAAKSRSIPLTVIRDTFDEGRKAFGHKLVLVRPDQFVAWVGDGPGADADEILARAAGWG